MTDRNKGILYMVLSSFFFALMAAAVKLSGDIPTIEKLFFRNIVGFLAAACLIYRSGGSYLGNNRRHLLWRSVFGLIALFLYFYAIDNLPLANAVILNQLSPFFVLILSALFLGEKILKAQGAALALALTGVLLVIKPEAGYTVVPALAGLFSAIFAGAAYVEIRHLRHSDHPQTIVFYFTALTTLASLPFLLGGRFIVPSPPQFLALIAVGVFATVGQFFLTHSYRYAEAGDLSIYSYGLTIFSIMTGIILFREIPDAFSFLGVALILSGAFVNWRARADPAVNRPEPVKE